MTRSDKRLNEGLCTLLDYSEITHFARWFKWRQHSYAHEDGQRFAYWMTTYKDRSKTEMANRRRLACAFMIAMIEAGDA